MTERRRSEVPYRSLGFIPQDEGVGDADFESYAESGAGEPGADAPAPVFEKVTSPLHASNDQNLQVYAEQNTRPPGWTVSDRRDNHVELFTLRREIADAFVAGYDYATKEA